MASFGDDLSKVKDQLKSIFEIIHKELIIKYSVADDEKGWKCKLCGDKNNSYYTVKVLKHLKRCTSNPKFDFSEYSLNWRDQDFSQFIVHQEIINDISKNEIKSETAIHLIKEHKKKNRFSKCANALSGKQKYCTGCSLFR